MKIFKAVLEFEFRAWLLLGKCFNTWTTSPTPDDHFKLRFLKKALWYKFSEYNVIIQDMCKPQIMIESG
jgi:hypothetical protein